MRAFAILAALIVPFCACAAITKEQALAFGSIEVVQNTSRNGVVLAAPHGTADCNTGVIVRNLAGDLGIPAVIASRFTRKDTGDHRINVNRPTEGANLRSTEELRTERAAHVWEEYRRLVLEAAGLELALYIEIHCNTHPATGGMIEVATRGVSREQAVLLKLRYAEARDRIVPGSAPKVDMKMEPVDRIYMGAAGAKKHGALGLAPVAIHIEIPGPITRLSARDDDPYRKVFASFLRDVIATLR